MACQMHSISSGWLKLKTKDSLKLTMTASIESKQECPHLCAEELYMYFRAKWSRDDLLSSEGDLGMYIDCRTNRYHDNINNI